MKDERAEAEQHEVVSNVARRDFIKTAGKIAITAPAVALLLRASAASATSTNPYGNGGTDHEIPVYPSHYQTNDWFHSWISNFFHRR